MANKVYKRNPINMRPKTKHKIKQDDDTINYLQVMKVNNWIGCVQNRKIWKESAVNKTKKFNETNL